VRLMLTFLLCWASGGSWLRRRCLVASYQDRCSREAAMGILSCRLCSKGGGGEGEGGGS